MDYLNAGFNKGWYIGHAFFELYLFDIFIGGMARCRTDTFDLPVIMVAAEVLPPFEICLEFIRKCASKPKQCHTNIMSTMQ